MSAYTDLGEPGGGALADSVAGADVDLAEAAGGDQEAELHLKAAGAVPAEVEAEENAEVEAGGLLVQEAAAAAAVDGAGTYVSGRSGWQMNVCLLDVRRANP